jgi:CHASE2 domain-containing sensor protein
MTPSTAFSFIEPALVAVLAIVAVAASIAVWRVGSLAPMHRCGLIAGIALIALAGIGWIMFVAPGYMD